MSRRTVTPTQAEKKLKRLKWDLQVALATVQNLCCDMALHTATGPLVAKLMPASTGLRAALDAATMAYEHAKAASETAAQSKVPS